MKYLQNLHTHSTYCDGKNTLEEMVLSGIEKGFASIGFSGHSYMHFSPKISMSLEGTEEYKKEIARLKEKYRGQISLFCGLEMELFSPVETAGYDYVIGSTHYFKINGEYVGFDRTAECVRKVVDEYFHGDGMAYAKAYYRQLPEIFACGNVDIIGHFDLIAKHAEKEDFFDQDDPAYLHYAYEAIEALRGKIPFFEVNTGAIARGYRTTPYPHIPIMKRLLESGFLPVISSDCHERSMLDCAFLQAEEILAFCGAKEKYILTEKGFQGVPLFTKE